MAVVTKVIMTGKTAIANINRIITDIICRGIVKINIPAFKISPNNLNAIKIIVRMRSIDNSSIVPPFFSYTGNVFNCFDNSKMARGYINSENQKPMVKIQ